MTQRPLRRINQPDLRSICISFTLTSHTAFCSISWHFGILTSAMHMAWLRQIGGRLKSDYRYSVGIVYNTFPWPEPTEQQQAKVRTLAQTVLDAREQFPSSTLADLYDIDAMPPQLRRAHRALDDAVDRLYRSTAFTGDRDRAEHLFGLYETLVAPLVVAAAAPKGRRGEEGDE